MLFIIVISIITVNIHIILVFLLITTYKKLLIIAFATKHSQQHLFFLHRFGFPKGFSATVAKEWFDRRRVSIRPWASFVDQRKFSKPRNFGEMCQRVVKNVDIYNSNYTFIFLGLILYCM